MSLRLVTPPGRQGPGPVAEPLVERLDIAASPRASGLTSGTHLALGLGEGMELAQLRAYQVGDDVRWLDASASARTGAPHVKLHVPERTLTTWLVVDVSPSMSFGTASRLKSDVAEGSASVLARVAVRRGGCVGLVTAGEPAPRTLPPRSGIAAVQAVGSVLRAGVAPDGTADAAALSGALRRVARLSAHQRALVLVLSDFRDADGLRPALAALTGRHTVIGLEIVDPRELTLPAVGHLTLVDPETGDTVHVDSGRRETRERYAREQAARREAVRADLRRAGAGHLTLSTGADWLRDLGRALSA